MFRTRIAPLMLLANLLTGPANAADIWDCSYAIDNDGHQHQTSYRVNGDELIIVRSGVKYRLLQNDDATLIAVSADSSISGLSNTVVTTGALLFIDKQNGKFLESWTMSDHLEGPFIFPGTCHKQ
jgi:hypothetical protein